MSDLVTGNDCLENEDGSLPHFSLRLFVAGGSVNSTRAITNLTAICAEHLDGHYTLQVIDVRENREIAAREQIVALPRLIKDTPQPVRRLIGDMSNKDRVLSGLGIL
jgi:circadian clock protein KaiB